MPVLDSADTTTHEMHGSRFTSYVAPARGSDQLCAWRLDVAPDTTGTPHRISQEEVLLVLDGELRVDVDGVARTVPAGQVIYAPAGSTLCVGTGSGPAAAWVVANTGLEAVTPDGARIVPPWTR